MKRKSASSGGPISVAAVRDLLLVHLDVVAARLKKDRSMTVVDVHDARKSIKRARAILRLLRPSLAEHEFARSKLELRQAGRSMSAVRDAQVIADRFDEMLQRTDIPESSVRGLADSLRAEAALVDQGLAARASSPAAALAAITATRKRLARTSLPATDWGPLGAGLRSIYRRGRQRMPGKADHASAKAMHEWRKQVKAYWHALEVFMPVRATQIDRAIGDAHRLADLLGEDHDLVLLADKLQTIGGAPEEPIQKLLDAIELRRRQLGRRASKIGAVLYAEPPAVMEKRRRHDWQKWRKE